MAILIIVALPWVFKNKSRSLLGRNNIFTTSRTKRYFKDRGGLSAYVGAAQVLSRLHCHAVGLVLGKDNYEYPLWILPREDVADTPWLEHVNVTNESRKYAQENRAGTSKPCAIFDLSLDLLPSTLSVGGGVVYSREWSAPVADGTDGFAGVYTRSLSR